MSAPRRRPQRGPDPGLPIRRRRRQRKRRRPLLVLLLIAAVLVVGVAVAAGRRRLRVRLVVRPFRPARGADRPEHLRLRRRRLAPRRDPGRAQPAGRPALSRQPVDAEGHDRDRGPPLLHATAASIRRASRAPSSQTSARARSSRAARRSRSSSSATSTSRTSARCSGSSRRRASRSSSTTRGRSSASSPPTSTRSTTGTSPTGSRRRRRPTSRSRASDLTLREAALLAGLTQAPSAYNPFVEPGKALARRNAVLRGDARPGRDHAEAVRVGDPLARPRPRSRGASTRRSRSRTSSATSATS